MVLCVRKHFRCKVFTGMTSGFIDTNNYLNLLYWSSLIVLIFSFFHCSLSDVMEDFLMSLHSLAASSSKCHSGRVDRMKQEILFPVQQNNMILPCTLLPLGRKSFLLSSYFTPQYVPQTQETLLQGTVVYSNNRWWSNLTKIDIKRMKYCDFLFFPVVQK